MATSSLSAVFLSFLSTPRAPSYLPSIAFSPLSQLPRVRACSASAVPDYLSLPAESLAVANPALAYSSTLFFNGYNVQVVVEDNEPEERLLGRFRREVMKAGVIQECKRRRFFENKHDEIKRKSREAAKRNRKRRPPPRISASTKAETSTNKKNDDDEDNWDLPEEGKLP
ncbi:hypothetical protein SAY87_004831 [Trapa incisa]|uniref:30S ribosomal protein S21, chloroplastic n=2 Tax=Trapa TaxID=22665 RepID=A0AAN7R0C6_TRANT|nr:hypothetical protein SAY87_004831 [Trapa incisa]KAK4781488.1 hypothetical protein SAY86_015590 [Trapa natans]